MAYVDPIPELKRQVAAELATLSAGWNADDIAAMIGTDRPRISEIRRGKLDRFSLETLIRYVTRLSRRVTLTIEPVPMPRGRATRHEASGGRGPQASGW